MSDVQEQVEIYIREDIDVTKRCWLIGALGRVNGIISAWFERGNHHRLTIRFEQGKLNHVTLLGAVKKYGYHGKIMHA